MSDDSQCLLRPAPRCKKHASVRLVPYQDSHALIKDFRGNSAFFRHTAGRYMAWREWRAYKRLQGIQGVPACLRRIPPDGLFLQYLPGINCLAGRGLAYSNGFFAALRCLLADIRDRGVLHGDVKRNVLMSEDGRPTLVDFGSSFVMPFWLTPFRKTVLRTARWYDDRSVAKLKQLVAPHLVDPSDSKLLGRRLPFESLLKIGEISLDHLLRRLLRG